MSIIEKYFTCKNVILTIHLKRKRTNAIAIQAIMMKNVVLCPSVPVDVLCSPGAVIVEKK